MSTEKMSLLDACKLGYLLILRLRPGDPLRFSPSGQLTMVALRNAIAEATDVSQQEVQESFEEFAYHFRDDTQMVGWLNDKFRVGKRI